MATLPEEQVIQRNAKGVVAIAYNGLSDSPGELLWESTTTKPYTVVDTKSVIANQQDRDVMEARIVAAGQAQYDDFNIYTEQGFGYDSNSQPLVVIGDGTEALAAGNNATTTLDISNYVAGGYEPLTYTLDAATVVDLAGASASMIGSVLQYVSGAVDGTDVAVVDVTDRDGNVVTVTVTITVA